MSILNIINRIAATSSRNEKEAILKENFDNELLKAVLVATYNPLISYYVQEIPYDLLEGNHGFIPEPLEEGLKQIESIANRTYTGDKAKQILAIAIDYQNADNGEILKRIIKRDLKCGISTSTINKVWKGLVPETCYQRCSLVKDAKFETWDWEAGVYSQLKADSAFCFINNADNGSMTMLTRSGQEYPLKEFTNILVEIGGNFPTNVQLSGELQVKRDGVILPREIGNGILNSIASGGKFAENEEAFYSVWDMLPLDQVVPKCKIQIPYSKRFADLKDVMKYVNRSYVELIETRLVHSLEEAYEHYFEVIAQGKEGTIIKKPDGIWIDGNSKEQIKLKVEANIELVCVGFNEGNGKNADTFGSLICESSDGLLQVGVSGFTDAMRKEIHMNRDKYLGAILTVTFNNIMNPTENNDKYSLFLPRFTEWRFDKSEADSLQRIIEQFEAVIKPKK